MATDTTSEWSAISLLKGIFGKINDGTLAADIVASGQGAIRQASAAATAMGNDLIARARSYANRSEAAANRSDGLLGMVAGAVAQCVHYMRLARASKLASATSETNASTSASNALTSENNSLAHAGRSTDAANFAAGTATFGQRAKKDRVAAQAARVGAEAALASLIPENLVLPMQIYS